MSDNDEIVRLAALTHNLMHKANLSDEEMSEFKEPRHTPLERKGFACAGTGQYSDVTRVVGRDLICGRLVIEIGVPRGASGLLKQWSS